MNEPRELKKLMEGIDQIEETNQETRINKINKLAFVQADKLIFQWVTSGVINVREFSELCTVNRTE